MFNWVRRGLSTGVKTTRYPQAPENAPGISPGRPMAARLTPAEAERIAARCPTDALHARDGAVDVDYRRCVHCYRCARGVDAPLEWAFGYEWATALPTPEGIDRAFHGPLRHSVHIRVVDAGDCGACLHEVKQLNNPYYNLHRLGFFITPTPRNADVLLVVGGVTEHMRGALQRTYDAMPEPKKVVAVGACALSGGVFGPSFASGSGVADVLPVHVTVPGNPPPPLAILHGLLVAVGRAEPAAVKSHAVPGGH